MNDILERALNRVKNLNDGGSLPASYIDTVANLAAAEALVDIAHSLRELVNLQKGY